MLRGRDRVPGRRVDDRDAGSRGRIEVDVVDADARAPDDDEPAARADQGGIDVDLAAHDERVVVGQDRAQLVARQPGSLVDLVVPPEQLEPFARHRFGDQDPHPGAPAVVGAASPYASIAAAWAAATDAPGRIGRPAPNAANSSVLRAPRISSTVTDPR